MEQKYDYSERPGFIFNGCEFLEGDIVTISTYDDDQYRGRIDSIYWWAFGGRQGMAITIIDKDGEETDLDDVEIQSMQWLG